MALATIVGFAVTPRTPRAIEAGHRAVLQRGPGEVVQPGALALLFVEADESRHRSLLLFLQTLGGAGASGSRSSAGAAVSVEVRGDLGQ